MRVAHLAIPLLAGAVGVSANGATEEKSVKRVAIIGAGAGGASAAYYLSQNARNLSIPTEITVYERNNFIGGRSTTVNAWNTPLYPIELGASIFVEVNHILSSAAKTFNLSSASPTINIADLPELGVWDGTEFVLVTSNEDGWWDKAKLLWRYGLAPIKTNRLMKGVVGKFERMYEEPVFPWRSLSAVVREVGLGEVVGQTGEQFLKGAGIGDRFAQEVIQASTRVNYAQNLPLIHGVETMVCMATSGATSIAGGNWQIFASMLNASATTHLNTSIASISKQKDNTYILTTSSGSTSTFDTVVLAAPLQYSKLSIDPLPPRVPDHIPYVRLHVTLFASPYRLDPAAFNMEAGKQVPQYVLTTLPVGETHGSDPNGVGSPGFFSISIVSTGLNPLSTPPHRPEYVYKIFSPSHINSTFLSKILGQKVTEADTEDGEANGVVSWIYHKIWHSYPYEYPRVTFDDIKVDEGLWYTSGIEAFISTMETSALMGKNVARLITDEWVRGKSTPASAAEEAKPEEDGETLNVAKPESDFTGLRDTHQEPIKAKL